jgi:hypothetical protein
MRIFVLIKNGPDRITHDFYIPRTSRDLIAERLIDLFYNYVDTKYKNYSYIFIKDGYNTSLYELELIVGDEDANRKKLEQFAYSVKMFGKLAISKSTTILYNTHRKKMTLMDKLLVVLLTDFRGYWFSSEELIGKYEDHFGEAKRKILINYLNRLNKRGILQHKSGNKNTSKYMLIDKKIYDIELEYSIKVEEQISEAQLAKDISEKLFSRIINDNDLN